MSDELVRLLRGLLRPGARKAPPALLQEQPAVVSAPTSTFEALLQERLRAVEAELAEQRNRVNGLLFLVVGTVLVQLLLRLAL